MLPNYSSERLIRTELSTLFGLVMRREIDFSYPGAHVIQSYIDRSNALLLELHESLVRPMREEISAMTQSPSTPTPGATSYVRQSSMGLNQRMYSNIRILPGSNIEPTKHGSSRTRAFRSTRRAMSSRQFFTSKRTGSFLTPAT
jgi:hypothetical protein